MDRRREALAEPDRRKIRARFEERFTSDRMPGAYESHYGPLVVKSAWLRGIRTDLEPSQDAATLGGSVRS
ncbi:hypothetical protein ACVIW0_005529 [Bradyrhizobium sp. USDA 4454]